MDGAGTPLTPPKPAAMSGDCAASFRFKPFAGSDAMPPSTPSWATVVAPVKKPVLVRAFLLPNAIVLLFMHFFQISSQSHPSDELVMKCYGPP